MSHPLLLLALIPWGALALYLLTSRPRVVVVSFLQLWPIENIAPSRFPGLRRPPLAIMAVLAAILLALLAAAGPVIRSRGLISAPLTLIVDRGGTMSARSGPGRRFQTLAAAAADSIVKSLGNGPANLVVVPGIAPREVDRRRWTSLLQTVSPTAVDTSRELAAAVDEALRNPTAIVIVLSDRKIERSDPRLVQIVPADSRVNIAIAHLSVRTAPIAQAMVGIYNDSGLDQATLSVSGADPISINLPPRASTGNYFVSLKQLPDILEAAISPGGDFDADNHARAVRGTAWPKVLARSSLPVELQRMIAVYSRNRPPQAESGILFVRRIESDASPDEPAAFVLADANATKSATGQIQWQSSPITDGINWTAAAAGNGLISDILPGKDWQAVVRSGPLAVVALRTAPARQVWVGLRSPEWALTPDFVVFWTKVFDWIGQGTGAYASQPAGPLGGEWHSADPLVSFDNNGLWPGIYRNGNQTVAVNASAIEINRARVTDWQSQLASLAHPESAATIDASPWLLLAAMLCLLISAAACHR